MATPLDPSPIFVIGFMATGKSTVGKLVADRLSRRFVDLDDRIEAELGKTIAEVFREEGEAAFRRHEERILCRVAGERDVVIATGGGAPCFGENLALMRREGVVVALSASMEEILQRAAPDASSRPLLPQAERLYREREAVYRSADVVVTTDGRKPDAVASEVTARARARLGTIAVRLGERSYPIHLAPLGSLGPLAREMLGPGTGRAAVVTDENVAAAGHAAAARASLEGSGMTVTELRVAPGEASKCLAEVERLGSAAVAAGLDRRSVVVCVGGGVVGDLGGFMASVLYRGISCVQVPTTLVAMVDSAIGGKTAVDLSAGKNLLGAFWQPRLVLADTHTLATLPERERRAGFGEVLKYGLISDRALWDAVAKGPPADPTDVIWRCAAIKAKVVSTDERETSGQRAVLNLGHTVGHAIEAAAGGSLLHGECVALGLLAAARLSAGLGRCPAALEGEIAEALRAHRLPTDLGRWLGDEVLAYIGSDKKRTGDKVRYVGLEAIGRTTFIDVEPAEIARILRSAKTR